MSTNKIHIPPPPRPSLRTRLENKAVAFIVEVLVQTGHALYKAHSLTMWFPNKRKAIDFFEPGKLYRFSGNPWLNMWDTPEGAEARGNNKTFGFFSTPLRRLPTGSLFMVLSIDRHAIDHVILKILQEEETGYIVLLQEPAALPWKHFEKIK